MKTKLNIDLADVLKRKYPHGFHVPADIDIDAFLEFADDDWEHELDIDIHELLDDRRAIALIWDAEQVRSHYPHLTDAQAWEVLQACERHYSAEVGLSWRDVEEEVNNLYPDAAEAKERLLTRLNTLRRQVEALPAEERAAPAAYGEIAAKLDAVEAALHGEA